ncbi:MAG: hypothetical protein WCO26_25690, partial [Deltaproteobacteria bacterium]
KGMPIDKRTDIYSLGVAMFEFFTGAYPYKVDFEALCLADKEKCREIMTDAITKGPFANPRQLNPRISEDLEKIILIPFRRL